MFLIAPAAVTELAEKLFVQFKTCLYVNVSNTIMFLDIKAIIHMSVYNPTNLVPVHGEDRQKIDGRCGAVCT